MLQFFFLKLDKSQMQRSDSDVHQPIDFQNRYLRDSSIKQETVFKNFQQHQELMASENKTQKKSKKILEDNDISSLYQKKNKLLNFMETIGECCFSPIRQDIMQHCEKLSKSLPCNLSRQTILKLVKNRVQKMIKNRRIKKNWSEQDLKILIWVISKYCQYHGISNVKDGLAEEDWINIASIIPGVSGIACMFKWLSLKKNNLAENSWVQQQSLLLDQMVKKYGQDNWCRVSQQLFLKNPLINKIYRCPKQCREHWNCYLNPQLKKGPWEPEEDYLLLSSVHHFGGVKKWAQIVKMFNGRTQNALKNRYNLIIEKQKKIHLNKKKQVQQIELIANYLRKHQKQFTIDQSAQQFLSERKKCLINEDQTKKKPKKVKPRKQKQKQQSELDEYIPDQGLKYNIERRSMRSKTKVRQFDQKSNEEKKQELYMGVSNISLRKSSNIFYQDQQNQIQDLQVKLQEERQANQANKTNNIYQNTPHSQHVQYQIPMQTHQQMQQQFGQIHQFAQNQVIKNIQIIPVSEEIINHFKRFAHTLIPCRISSMNQQFRIEKFQSTFKK